MKQYLILTGCLACLAIIILPKSANAQSRAKASRYHLLMDRDWKFFLGDDKNASAANFNDGGWRELDLPHDWSIEGKFDKNASAGGGGGYLPTGTGWYRKQFTLSASSINGKQVSIQFDGVHMNSEVWINNHYLGKRPNGYISFVYDLTRYLLPGKNTIAVRVDNSMQPNSRWYSGSGIYRHVWLNITNALHVAQSGTYITTPDVSAKVATVSVKTAIENHGFKGSNVVLTSKIYSPDGQEVASADIPISDTLKTNGAFTQQLTISSPMLWDVDSPRLYKMRSIIRQGGKIIDDFESTFGVRKIEYSSSKGFLLNGKRVKMNGVCLHNDAGSVGTAVPEAMWVRRLKILKDMGCNAIRTSHNPAAPEFLDLCDKMGFLVMDEMFDEWKSGKVKYGISKFYDEWSQRDLTDFIRRDRNHPSVVMWSAGNEIGEQAQSNGSEILRPLIETFHREDPTRPVTTGNDLIAADGRAAKLPFLEMLDIVGYNYVDRWHERRELFYSIDHQDHPNWKMVGTESVSIRGMRGNYYKGGDRGVDVDSSVIRPVNMASVIRAEQLWKFVSLHDYVIGDFMWTGIDYLGEAKWPAKSSTAGVIDLCGFPKDSYYFYQSQWTPKPMVHLLPHWNWKGKEGTIIQVMAYTNCDSVELFLNGKSYGIKSLDFPRQGNARGWDTYATTPVYTSTADLHLIWDVPYTPGVLSAVGKKNGKIAYKEEIHTTGEPEAIRLSFDKNSLDADQYDVSHLKIEIIDKNGYVVPDADNLIQVKVNGAGKLIGLDNGHPLDITPMKENQRKTFNGLALAVIQSAEKTGDIQVEVSAPNLKTASAKIKTQNVRQPRQTIEDLKK
jgi:beta-galactosidase